MKSWSGTEAGTVAVLGASSFVGRRLCQQLVRNGFSVHAFSRRDMPNNGPISWRSYGESESEPHEKVDCVISLVPIWCLSQRFLTIKALNPKRVVALSSTSRFTKAISSNPKDAKLAQSIANAEDQLQDFCTRLGIEYVILRSTMIYGEGQDRNVTAIAQFIERYRFFPILGAGSGLRQPVRSTDVAIALLCASVSPAAAGNSYQITGGETLTYREMVLRIFAALERKPVIPSVPAWLVRAFIPLLRFGPHRVMMLAGVGERMNVDMTFDCSAARQDLGFIPRPFEFTRADLQASTDPEEPASPLSQTAPETPSFDAEQRIPAASTACAVVIVSYNAGDLLAKTVRSAWDAAASEIVVVDNASSDNSLAGIEAVDVRTKVIRNDRNLGFAKACNIGFEATEAPNVLFLNPDCEVKSETITKLLAILNSASDIGMVGPMLLNADGSEQAAGRRRLPTFGRGVARGIGFSRDLMAPELNFDADTSMSKSSAIPVEAISGSCMMVKRAAAEDVGPWDEGYFLHVEDLDYCKRFASQGWRIFYVRGAVAVHVKGASSHSRAVFVEWHKHLGMIRYYEKFLATAHPHVLRWLIKAGILARFSIQAVRLSFQKAFRKHPSANR